MSEEPMMQKVSDLGEEKLVTHLIDLLPPGTNVIAGPGDDCAVIDLQNGLWQLLKTDCLVEGVHFEAGTDPQLVGRKAMNRVISDIAAMGGAPQHALVTLAMDSQRRLSEVDGWYRGMIAAADNAGCGIIGGETSRLPLHGAVISIAMTGVVTPGHCVLRNGAAPGDIIAVTGQLGGSFTSGRHLTFAPRLKEAQWLVRNAKPTSMMDLSDGLGSDLPRLVKASRAGYRVEPQNIPCHVGVCLDDAISDGEDYELLLTFAPEVFQTLAAEWEKAFPGTNLTAIGEVTAKTMQPLARGWEHYCHE